MFSSPERALEALAGSTSPYLIGVRHHSPALSVVVGELLDAHRPEVLLLELPAEFAEWLPWLADERTAAPIALAGVAGPAGDPAFYPFADFSPELVAVRWAARNGVEVVPCDLPLADRAWHERHEPPEAPDGDDAPPAAEGVDGRVELSLASALRDAASGRPDEDMWDRVVEARAPGTGAEAVRRAALLVGWAMRRDAVHGDGVSPLDLRREAWMRRCLVEAGARRVAAVVGSFHATALLDPGAVGERDSAAGGEGAGGSAAGGGGDGAGGGGGARRGKGGAAGKPVEVATSLVPYTFSLLDARSGYPAGIRDPQWQQAVVGAAGDPEAVEAAALGAVVRVCAGVRAAGHPSGPAEAREAFRFAVDLARLRGLPAPGRGELVEALQTGLAHGEVLGRGRVVAAAMERELVGDVRGALAPGTPQSGLRPAVTRLVADLRLPGPGEKARELRLDPLRSDLDRRRQVALRQLEACGVPYGEHTATEGTGGTDALTSHWQVGWTPGTDAMLDVVGVRGVTLAQAAEGTLRYRRRAELAENGPTAAQVIEGLAVAAECGLVALARERVAEVASAVPDGGSLREVLAALALVDRLRHGHIAGMPPAGLARLGDLAAILDDLETAAVRQVDGLAGSEDIADAGALLELAHRADGTGGGLRLADCLERLARTGTPMMAAAAAAIRVVLGQADAAELGTRITSWVDAARDATGRRHLQARLTGLLAVAEPLLQAGGATLEGLLDRVESLPDADFLGRLPALRGGFQAVSPAARDRLLAVVTARLGEDQGHDIVDGDPAMLLLRLLADRAGRAALADLDLLPPADTTEAAPSPVGVVGGSSPVNSEASAAAAAMRDSAGPAVEAPVDRALADVADRRGRPAPPSGNDLSTVDRWRLLLGRQSDRLGSGAARYATALDELYGAGHGEGSRADAADRGGRQAPYPGVREWAEELSALFGPGVREEVLARAAEAGRRDAAMLLDPDAATPSVELLQTVLSLAGALPEASVARLRPLVARIVAELTRQLAARLRPALAGLTTPRPTRRPGGRLDLPRTLRANLATTRRDEQGRVRVVPERPIFHTRARRGVDWRLVLVVDVSGSMEASVIWSALTGAILAGVPALTTHFIAFSTEVVDLTERVDDPLGLLLEVKVGGGTHIAAGLRHARSLVTVPSRTLVVVVSDFEEGYPMGALLGEARALVESGVKLLGCASLNDQGRPRYSVSVAQQLVACGMPVAALSPLELAHWVGDQVRS